MVKKRGLCVKMIVLLCAIIVILLAVILWIIADIFKCMNTGRAEYMKNLLKKLKKEPKKKLNTVNTLFEAMKSLEKKGVRIKQIEVTKELADKMENQRNIFDSVMQDPNFGPDRLLFMDIEFDSFISIKNVPKKIMKKKPKNFIGMIFSIDVLVGK